MRFPAAYPEIAMSTLKRKLASRANAVCPVARSPQDGKHIFSAIAGWFHLRLCAYENAALTGNNSQRESAHIHNNSLTLAPLNRYDVDSQLIFLAPHKQPRALKAGIVPRNAKRT